MKFLYKTLFIFILLKEFMLFAQDKPAYLLYDSDGKKTDYKDVMKKTAQADIVLFGEIHNNPICHWLQFELTKDLFETKKQNLILGAEMFEADIQIVLNEYLSGKIKESHLETEGKVWSNYKTDYSPLVNFAKQNQIPFIATNIPRRYANLVSREGLESLNQLDTLAKSWICPLPIEVDLELPNYKAMLSMMGAHGNSNSSNNFVKAQAVKDATMAFRIVQHLQKDKIFLHFHGTYHSNNFEGIVWYLKKLRPDLQIVTISSVEQKEIEKLEKEYIGLANFIVCIPASMTKTH
ncbi:MAG: hypothetical protein OHK0038_11160 [Flammeovirgaceae bacterium]